jgi:hypothetical protein
MQRGERIAGRFEILAEAGRGGMGTVFRTLDRRDRREVALKVVETALRFEREATILAEIEHPNVVKYIAHGATPDGVSFLVMEWVDGENLGQRLDREGLDPAETVQLGVQVARALAALHARGIVHRDVKPSNIMLMDSDIARVKLVDFGVARRAVEATSLTRTGVMVGTAGYMSPEQARGVRGQVDSRADLFALGCVLHECLTGHQAFAGETTMATRAKVLLHDPPPLRLLAPQLPPGLDALVTRLLAKRPVDRPDAAEAERSLAALADLPAGRAARVTVQHAAHTTITPSEAEAQLCAILVAWPPGEDAPEAIESIAGGEPFEGGWVLTLAGNAATAARMAQAIAARAPGASVVVAAGDARADAIDRAAHLLAEADLAGETRGVWIEPATARRLGGSFDLEARGELVRLRI